MGGSGSGRWSRFDRKLTVEESLSISVRDFRSLNNSSATGTVNWKGVCGQACSIAFVLELGDVPTITLHYLWQNSEEVQIPVRLQTTPTQFGGKRWWFTCPLMVGRVACNRRVERLHLPNGSRYFGCRGCHRLTYRSCQEAHQTERLFGRMSIPYDHRAIKELLGELSNKRCGWGDIPNHTRPY